MANGAGDYLVFVILNADSRDQTVRIPDPGTTRTWRRVADTSLPGGQDFLDEGDHVLLAPPDLYVVQPRSAVVLLAR